MLTSTSQKGLSSVIILSIIILIVIGGSWWFKSHKYSAQPIDIVSSSPIPDSTITSDPNKIGFKKFQSAKYGYEISFPEKWITVSQGNEDLIVWSEQITGWDLKESMSLKTSVNSFDEATPKGAFNQFNKDFSLPVGDKSKTDKTGSVITKLKNFEIDNYDTIEFSTENNYEGPQFTYFYEIKLDENTILSLKFTAKNKATLDQNADLTNQILSSLKISPRPLSSPISYTTYENTEYGFSFKYPSTWSVQDFHETNLPQMILRDTDSLGRLSLGLEPGYTDSCPSTEVDLDEVFYIDTQPVKLRDFCDKKSYYLESKNGTKIYLSTSGWGYVAESYIKEVLRSLIGLKVVPQKSF